MARVARRSDRAAGAALPARRFRGAGGTASALDQRPAHPSTICDRYPETRDLPARLHRPVGRDPCPTAAPMTPELARIIAAMVDAKLDAIDASIDSARPTRGTIARRPTGRAHHANSGRRSRTRS